MHETNQTIRCRLKVNPHVHCELSTHLNEIDKKKWGDRILQLAVIGLSFLQQPKYSGHQIPQPLGNSDHITQSTKKEEAPEIPSTVSKIDTILGSPEDFAKAMNAMEKS